MMLSSDDKAELEELHAELVANIVAAKLEGKSDFSGMSISRRNRAYVLMNSSRSAEMSEIAIRTGLEVAEEIRQCISLNSPAL